jgi:hypothetical protein
VDEAVKKVVCVSLHEFTTFSCSTIIPVVIGKNYALRNNFIAFLMVKMWVVNKIIFVTICMKNKNLSEIE